MSYELGAAQYDHEISLAEMRILQSEGLNGFI